MPRWEHALPEIKFARTHCVSPLRTAHVRVNLHQGQLTLHCQKYRQDLGYRNIKIQIEC